MAKFASAHPLGDLEKLITVNPDAEVTLTVRHDFAVVQLFSRKNKETSLAKTLGLAGGPGEASDTKSFSALPVSPGQWLVVSKKSAGAEFGESLKKEIRTNGYVSEQSAARVCFRVSGPKTLELLSRGCRLDLHGSKKGFCAQTAMAQVGVQIHQPSDEIAYDLYVYSGFARSFWHWLETSAVQFGYSVNIDGA